MKKGAFLGVMAAMLAGNAMAQGGETNVYAGIGYGVVTAPDIDDLTGDHRISFDDANNGFIQLGYKFTENFAIEGQYSKSTKDASAEAFVESIDITEVWWDEVLRANPGLTQQDVRSTFPYATMDMNFALDVNIETTALYGVFRSSGDLYFKAKAGYLREKSTVTVYPQSFDLFVDVVYPNDPIEFSSTRGDEEFDNFAGDSDRKLSESASGFSAGLGVGYKVSRRFFSELEYTMLNDDLDFYSLSINYAF